MKTALAEFILVCSIALGAQNVKIHSSDGEVTDKGSHSARRIVRMEFPLEKPAILTYLTTRDTEKNTYSAHPHTHLGFNDWGNMTYIYPGYPGPYNQWETPDYVWTSTRKDGGAITQIVIPVVDPKKDNEKAGSYSVRIVQLPQFKEWLFMRTTFEGVMPVHNEYVFAGTWTAFSVGYGRPGAARYGYVAGKHYLSYGTEKIPADLEFDGFAIYAVNSVAHDKDLNLMVFNPGQFARKNLDFYYWVKGFRLDCVPKKESPVLTVACARFITDTPKEDAEKFFAEGKDKAVREAMANLNWEPEIDPSPAKAQLDKAAKTLKTVTNAMRKKSLEDLSIALKKAEAEKDYNNYFKTLDALNKLNDELTKSNLDSMLDE